MVDGMEDEGLDTRVEKEGGNNDRVEDRFVDVGNINPVTNSKFTLKAAFLLFWRVFGLFFFIYSCSVSFRELKNAIKI